jgi:DHA1 family multidrug/chloramphenicol efflux transport protein-like MFS transporter
VAGYAAIHEIYDSKIAIKVIALLGSISLLAPALGPVFGAIVIEISNWRTIFYILGTGGALSLILLFLFMPKTQEDKVPLNLKAILKDYLKIAIRKDFLVFALPVCFIFLALISWLVESPFLLIQAYHQTTLEFGLYQAYIFGSFIIGSQVTGWLINRLNPMLLIKIGLVIALIGAINLVLVSALICPLAYIIIFMMVIGFGSGISFGPFNRLAVETCQEPIGRTMAIFSSYQSLFCVVATVLAGVCESNNMLNLSILVATGIALAFAVFFFMKKPNLTLHNNLNIQ